MKCRRSAGIESVSVPPSRAITSTCCCAVRPATIFTMIPVVGPVAPVGPDEPEGEGLGLAVPAGDGLAVTEGDAEGEGLGVTVGVGDGEGLVDGEVVGPVAPVAPLTDANESGTFPPSETINETRTTIDADLSGRNLRPRRRGRPGKFICPIPSSRRSPPAPQRRCRRSSAVSEAFPNPGVPRPAHAEDGNGCPAGHVVAIRRGRPKVSKCRPT